MIENKIQMLRRAAKVTPKDEKEDLWCAIAGNNKIINTVLFALTKTEEIKLIFRKHVTVESKHVHKKFDVVMLKGNQYKMDELIEISKKYGGAHIRIAQNYIKTEPNLMLLVGPDDNLRSYVKDLKKANVELDILLENETQGFIETELQSDFKLPKSLKNVIDPIFNASDVVIGNVLISIQKNSKISISKKLAKKNNIFLVDLEKLMKSVEKTERNKKIITENQEDNKSSEDKKEEEKEKIILI